MIIPSDLKQVRVVIDKLQTALEKKNVDKQVLFDMKLVTEEALVNAIKHGNGLDESKVVRVDIETDAEKIEISIEDQGEGFDYKKIPNPTKDENLEKTSGRGVFLIKQIMDEVRFNKPGNCITMIKYL